MQRKLWEITSHMLLKARLARWWEREHLQCAGGCSRGAGPTSFLGTALWLSTSALFLPRRSGSPAGQLSQGGRGTGPVPSCAGPGEQSVRAGAVRCGPALFLEVCELGRAEKIDGSSWDSRNSPISLPFSHNKHTAKSLAGRFDEATCISPFSVYRKLLVKKVILVFMARVKGPGCLAPHRRRLSGQRGEVQAGGRPGMPIGWSGH